MRPLPEIRILKLEDSELDTTVAIQKEQKVPWYVIAAPPKPGVDLEWSTVVKESNHAVVPMFRIRGTPMDLVSLGMVIGRQLPDEVKEVRILYAELPDGRMAIGIAGKE